VLLQLAPLAGAQRRHRRQSSAQTRAGSLGNAVLLTRERYGHLSFQDPSTCVDDAMARYLTGPITPPEGTVCQSDHEPFDPNFNEPRYPPGAGAEG
jgi:hypothetical protein